MDCSALARENEELKLSLQECREMLRADKEIIGLLVREQGGQALLALERQHQALLARLQTSESLREQAEAKSMICEKIVRTLEERERMAAEEINEEIGRANETMLFNEQKISQYERLIKEVDEVPGFIVKYKEVTVPSQQVLSLNAQNEHLQLLLSIQLNENKSLKSDSERLLKLNIVGC
jgi:hypothetical protein